MRRALGSAALGLLLAAMAAGAAAPGAPRVAVRGEATYEVGDKIILKAGDFPFKDAEYEWDVEGPLGKSDPEFEAFGDRLCVWAKPGTYVVRLRAISWTDKKSQSTKFRFTVTGAAPKPPGPKPDDPVDPVDPTPAPAKSVRVLVVYDPAKAYPAAQQLIVQGQPFRDYTKALGKTDADNPIGPARIWPKDADVSRAPAEWAELFKGRKNDTGLVVQADGKVVKDVPLPADADAAIALIKPYAPKAKRPALKLRKAG
jgi:hypothetical protein